MKSVKYKRIHRCHRWHSGFLVSRSGFLTGMGSVFDLFGSYYRRAIPMNDHEADAEALRSDWYLIGQDISNVLKGVKTP